MLPCAWKQGSGRCLRLPALHGESGVWHVANRGATSWAELAEWTVSAAGLDRHLVIPVPGDSLGHTAPRPRNVPLASERGAHMPTLEHAIESYLSEIMARPRRELIDHGLPVETGHGVTPVTP